MTISKPKIYMVLMATILLLPLCINAQTGRKKQAMPQYTIETKFTGEVKTGMDSTFMAYAVFNEADVANVKLFTIKTGKNIKELKETVYTKKDNPKIRKSGTQLFVPIGQAGRKLKIIEVECKDNSGNIHKLKMKKNEKNS